MTRTIIESHPHTFIVGFEDSEQGRDALALARWLAAPTGARLVAVTAYDTSVLLGEQETGWAEGLRKKAHRALAPLQGVDKRAVAARMPAHAIQAAAEEEDAEMIVLGSCHHGVVGRILMGSTAEDVMRGASCPVAIAPNGYAQELADKLFGAERSMA